MSTAYQRKKTLQSAQENSSSEFNLPVYARTEPRVHSRVANHQGGIPNGFFFSMFQEANHELPFYMKNSSLNFWSRWQAPSVVVGRVSPLRILGPKKKGGCPGVDVEAGPALDGERYAVPNVTTKAKRMDIAVAPDYS
jgi:hypothetical protein